VILLIVAVLFRSHAKIEAAHEVEQAA